LPAPACALPVLAEGEKRETFELPVARASHAIPKPRASVTVRLHRDGTLDLDPSNLVAALKAANVETLRWPKLERTDLHEVIDTLDLLRDDYARLGRKLKFEFVRKSPEAFRTSTLQIRFEMDHRVEWGRAAWVLSSAWREEYGNGWIVVKDPAHAGPRGLRADYWQARPRKGIGLPPSLPICIRGAPPRDGKPAYEYFFAGRGYSGLKALGADLKKACAYLRRGTENTKLPRPTLFGSGQLPLQLVADCVVAVHDAGAPEMNLTPYVNPGPKAMYSKPMAKPKPSIVESRSVAIWDDDNPIDMMARTKHALVYPTGVPNYLAKWRDG
jgi:hypothetical protein